MKKQVEYATLLDFCLAWQHMHNLLGTTDQEPPNCSGNMASGRVTFCFDTDRLYLSPLTSIPIAGCLI